MALPTKKINLIVCIECGSCSVDTVCLGSNVFFECLECGALM